MTDQLQRMMKKLEGDGPIEKHILLLKLTEALENAPEFGDQAVMDTSSPQRQWLSKVGALLSRLGIDKKVKFQSSFNTLVQYWKHAIVQIQGQVLDAIEEIKLELELEDRSDIGSAYAPGDVYRFFADLKDVVNSAESEVMIVDPYFNGEAFDAYLSSANPELGIKILADRYSKDISAYAEKHKAQYGTDIELRRSKELHDRIIFIDHDVAWIMGGSIKDAGKKATYLIPLQTPIALAKKEIYQEIWSKSKEVECSA
ncbi:MULTISPECIES: hypothetical protein [Pseudoalteromonas]|uniref:hypothetical protein n=1 Tax=Pseudoalteromonas TaxID=53246 RepID=UPI000C7B6FAA|nr:MULTISPECIES: hypothetical protein [Pseudoalteromonas]AUJ69728.1 hypothetical protein PNC201_07150 [Pseudoalteromonas sp. NC201]QZO14567.1 hypothetical protein K5642_08770 [Pseudoalteromonas piscicida]